MIRALRILSVVSILLIVGYFLLGVTSASSGESFRSSFGTYSIVSSLDGELAFAVAILALVETARRRQFAWFALFALLLALLNALPLFLFQLPASFMSLFEAPLSLFGRFAWIILIPALIPGAAFIYTLAATVRRPVLAAGKERGLSSGFEV